MTNYNGLMTANVKTKYVCIFLLHIPAYIIIY